MFKYLPHLQNCLYSLLTSKPALTDNSITICIFSLTVQLHEFAMFHFQQFPQFYPYGALLSYKTQFAFSASPYQSNK